MLLIVHPSKIDNYMNSIIPDYRIIWLRLCNLDFIISYCKSNKFKLYQASLLVLFQENKVYWVSGGEMLCSRGQEVVQCPHTARKPTTRKNWLLGGVQIWKQNHIVYYLLKHRQISDIIFPCFSFYIFFNFLKNMLRWTTPLFGWEKY